MSELARHARRHLRRPLRVSRRGFAFGGVRFYDWPAEMTVTGPELPSDHPTLSATFASGSELETRVHPDARRGRSASLPRGEPIGRYVILARIGSGGMGTVYAAYDPELDRKVAVKLMHVDAGSETLAGRRRNRLLREAQAMARLSHPNVVAVHDVGAIGDDIFVAMEFVDGQTLTEWTHRSRPWREIVALFEQAGRGLAAAHEKDLVHRDFKPDNVLVGTDGRVRVTDFGLARAVTDPGELESVRLEPTAQTPLAEDGALLGSPLTMTGAILGTPAYMSPEQFMGQRADARSDQFSYCVALWEALYGRRPFAGDSPAALSVAVTQGELRAPPRERDVPLRLRRALERGLSPRAPDRFTSMDALLAALRPDPARRRRRLAWGAGGALASVAVAAGLLVPARDAGVCDAGAEKLVGVWDADERARVRAAFEAGGRSYGAVTGATVIAGLDAYARAWEVAYVDACEDTRVRAEQSSELLDLRMGCLDRRRIELEELVDRLARADEATVRVAVRAVERLGRLETCADRDALLAPVRPPDDPDRRRAVDAVEAQLARGRAITNLGNYSEALELLAAAFESAELTAHRPLIADAGYELGVVQWLNDDPARAVETLQAAFHEAVAARHDARAAETATELVHVRASSLEDFTGAADWAAHARGFLERLGQDPESDARLTNALGILHEQKGEYEHALRLYQASVEAREKTHGRRDLGVANAINNIALVLEIQTKYADALAKHQEAMAIRAELGGPEHPDVADSSNNIGMVLQGMGRFDEARRSFERAIEIYDAALGPGSLSSASALNNLGTLMQAMGEPERSLELFARSLAIRERELGAENALLASILKNRGHTLIELERFDQARPELERALAIQQAQLGPDHPYGAETMSYLGDLERALGNHDAAIARYVAAIDVLERAFPGGHAMIAQIQLNLARVHRDGTGDADAALAGFEQALSKAESTVGQTHSMTGNILHELGVVHLEAGRPSTAVSLLERSLGIREKEHTPDVAVGNTRFALARALAKAGETARALELADAARLAYVAADRPDRLAELDGWLARERARTHAP